MDESVLVYPDIHKRAEGGHVGHDAFQLHALFHVFQFRHVIAEGRFLEVFARVAPRLLQFGDDVLQGRQPDAGRVD